MSIDFVDVYVGGHHMRDENVNQEIPMCCIEQQILYT